ncbi:hypothetical protein [Agarivorans sp. QJM3NY_33]|uniref:hypothetical protein n=1 Tax=Agarivorans sp. QJM3NY_33 TaxID=3421432 RepID=UPI003D7DA546
MKAKLKLVLWIAIALLAIVGMQGLSSNYSLSDMRAMVDVYYWYILPAYTLVIFLRGVLFIPTMPLILLMASSIDPLLMFLLTLVASCSSAYLVCLAIDYMDMQKRLEALPSKSVQRAQRWVRSFGVAAIAGWAFFPLVFTELIVYLARLAGLPRRQIVMAVGLGEGLLISGLIVVVSWFTSVAL